MPNDPIGATGEAMSHRTSLHRWLAANDDAPPADRRLDRTALLLAAFALCCTLAGFAVGFLLGGH